VACRAVPGRIQSAVLVENGFDDGRVSVRPVRGFYGTAKGRAREVLGHEPRALFKIYPPQRYIPVSPGTSTVWNGVSINVESRRDKHASVHGTVDRAVS